MPLDVSVLGLKRRAAEAQGDVGMEEDVAAKRPFAGMTFAVHAPLPFAQLDNAQLKAAVEAPGMEEHPGLVAAEGRYSAAVTEHYEGTPGEEMDTDATPTKADAPAAGTASPNTAAQYIASGNYSPRQVTSFCRPAFGAYGFHCPYPSDIY